MCYDFSKHKTDLSDSNGSRRIETVKNVEKKGLGKCCRNLTGDERRR
jgi:hypothetical protein